MTTSDDDMIPGSEAPLPENAPVPVSISPEARAKAAELSALLAREKGELDRLRTALTDRDAQIERLTRERDGAIREMSEWATKAGEAEGRLKASEWPGVVEGWQARATTAERDLAEARAEVERKDAALAILAEPANWRWGGLCDPNSGAFIGEAIARAALRPNGGDDAEG